MKIASLSRPRIGALILLGLAVIATWTSVLDQRAARSVDTGFERAGITFASARGLNAVISAAKGTEVNVGIGLGATFSIGEALDPVDDLVEQFADLMLLATVSFGIQKVLLVLGQHWLVQVGLTIALGLWAALLAFDRPRGRWLRNLLTIALLVRFAVPVAAVGTDMIFKGFLESDYAAAQRDIDQSTATVKAATPQPTEEKGPISSALDWIAAQKKSVLSAVDPRPALENLKKTAEDTVQDVIRLIVVFLLQTLLVPLAILFALIFLVRGFVPTQLATSSAGTPASCPCRAASGTALPRDT